MFGNQEGVHQNRVNKVGIFLLVSILFYFLDSRVKTTTHYEGVRLMFPGKNSSPSSSVGHRSPRLCVCLLISAESAYILASLALCLLSQIVPRRERAGERETIMETGV